MNYQLCERLYRDREVKRQVNEFARRGSTLGRQRAFRRIHEAVRPFGHLQEVRFTGPAPLALWMALVPRGPVIMNPTTPGETQDCVTINYVLIGVSSRSGARGRLIADGLWTAEIADHALLRVLQRDPGVDLTAVLLAVHRTLLRLPTDLARRACAHLVASQSFDDPRVEIMVIVTGIIALLIVVPLSRAWGVMTIAN